MNLITCPIHTKLTNNAYFVTFVIRNFIKNNFYGGGIVAEPMTKEEILNEAEICYNNCRIILQGLCNITKTIDENFDEKVAFEQFDIILQALLFSQAIADGDFCEAEKDFIKKLADKIDIFEHITAEGFDKLNLEQVYALSNAEQGKLALSINDALNTYADDFVLPFAILDASTTTDSLTDLAHNLAGISILLGAVDGQITEDELAIFNHYAEELIIGKWEDVKAIAEAMTEVEDELDLEDNDDTDMDDDSDDSDE